MELEKELIIKIERFNNEGEGVGLYNDFVIFVKGALIDEEVQVKIVDIKKNYAIGKLINVLIPSKERVEPICPYYNTCGGCDIMHMSNELQLEFKKKKIEDIFKKVCKIDVKVKEENKINFIFCGTPSSIKSYEFDDWFRKYVNNKEGIWIGNGIADQGVIKIDNGYKLAKEKLTREYAFIIKKGTTYLAKIITKE